MNTHEVWLPVAGFPLYEVSNLGRVRSWRRKARVWRDPCDEVRSEPIIVTGTTAQHGYTAHMLRRTDDPKPYRRTVHRLVALAFLPNPRGLSDVAHQDGNPANNRADNLRWSTHRDNQMDMRRHGTMQDGERCVTAKLTTAQVDEIRRRAQVRGEGVKLAREFGLSKAQISRIKTGKRWHA